LVELQKSIEAVSASGIQLIGVSYDSVKILKKFSEKSNISFPLLSDRESKTINSFGIHYQKGLPQPCTYLIGKDRRVLASIFLDGYRNRHTPTDLIEMIQKAKP